MLFLQGLVSASPEVPILCSVLAMLRGRQTPKCGREGERKKGKKKRRKERRKEGRKEGMEKGRKKVRTDIEQVIQGLYMVSGTRCSAWNDS